MSTIPSDYTAEQLLKGLYTLNQVDDLVYDGRISVEVANAYFREWVVGKLEHRWNAEAGRPEECLTNPRTGAETWREMRWG